MLLDIDIDSTMFAGLDRERDRSSMLTGTRNCRLFLSTGWDFSPRRRRLTAHGASNVGIDGRMLKAEGSDRYEPIEE